MSKRKVVRLDGTQKSAIIAEIEHRQKEGIGWSLSSISEWAKEKWSLDSAPHIATISRIVRDKVNILELVDDGEGTRKKRRTLKSDALEAGLVMWMWDQYAQHIFVSDDKIKQKGMRILTLANKKLPDEKRIDMKFSNGWLEKFKKRNKLMRYRSSNHALGCSDQVTPVCNMPKIIERISKFAVKDVWNADEFGLFYMLGPYDSTGSRGKSATAQTKRKPRLTFLACANGDGTERFPIMAIGKANKKLCFRRRTEDDLKFDYHQNVHSCMNTMIFFEWLKKFDRFIGKTKGRKAILLLDTASCHGKSDMLPELEHVQVVFLPSNIESSTLPMYAGAIPCIKRRYRRRQMSRALDVLDEDTSKLYKIDQVTAMKWVCDIWEELEQGVIRDGWRRLGVFKNTNGVEDKDLLSKIGASEQTDIDVILRQVHPHRTRKHITIAEFLNPVGEDDCIAHISEQSLVEDVVNALKDCNDTSHKLNSIIGDASEHSEDVVSKMSCKDQLQHLGYAIRILERNVMVPDKFRRIVDSTKIHLRAEYKNVELRDEQKKLTVVSAEQPTTEIVVQQKTAKNSSLKPNSEISTQLSSAISAQQPRKILAESGATKPAKKLKATTSVPQSSTAATPVRQSGATNPVQKSNSENHVKPKNNKTLTEHKNIGISKEHGVVQLAVKHKKNKTDFPA